MPKLGQYAPILKAVFFLYPDKASALSGVQSGGTGFLVGVPWKTIPNYQHVHAVTNYHVAVFNEDSPPSPVVRINLKSGGADPIEFDPSEWVFKASASDVAISPPLEIGVQHDFMNFDRGWFLTKPEEAADEIGPGEDVFMIGRFVDYDGVETNAPAARFGHISMMTANIPQPTGYTGRSIVLDMHSRSGFSGSPVIVFRTIGSHFMEGKPGHILTGGGHYIKLLGMHYAQFPEAWELKQKKAGDPLSQAALKADSHYVEGLSGMTCVVPAADILDLLDDQEIQVMRDKREARLLSHGLQVPKMGPKPEAASKASPPASDENPTHREDFNRLLGAAAQKREQED